MKAIHLHGALAEQFGPRFDLDVRDPAEAIHAIGMQLPAFRQTMGEGNWHVFKGPLDAQNDLDIDGLMVSFGKSDEIHIMPAVEGAGEVFNVIAGITLFAVGVFTGNPALMYAGGAMALGGVAQMLTSPPAVDSYGEREQPDQRPSFVFDGPVNTSTQGLPVPLPYGRVRCGSTVVSAGLSADDIPLDDEEESEATEK